METRPSSDWVSSRLGLLDEPFFEEKSIASVRFNDLRRVRGSARREDKQTGPRSTHSHNDIANKRDEAHSSSNERIQLHAAEQASRDVGLLCLLGHEVVAKERCDDVAEDLQTCSSAQAWLLREYTMLRTGMRAMKKVQPKRKPQMLKPCKAVGRVMGDTSMTS